MQIVAQRRHGLLDTQLERVRDGSKRVAQLVENRRQRVSERRQLQQAIALAAQLEERADLLEENGAAAVLTRRADRKSDQSRGTIGLTNRDLAARLSGARDENVGFDLE